MDRFNQMAAIEHRVQVAGPRAPGPVPRLLTPGLYPIPAFAQSPLDPVSPQSFPSPYSRLLTQNPCPYVLEPCETNQR